MNLPIQNIVASCVNNDMMLMQHGHEDGQPVLKNPLWGNQSRAKVWSKVNTKLFEGTDRILTYGTLLDVLW